MKSLFLPFLLASFTSCLPTLNPNPLIAKTQEAVKNVKVFFETNLSKLAGDSLPMPLPSHSIPSSEIAKLKSQSQEMEERIGMVQQNAKYLEALTKYHLDRSRMRERTHGSGSGGMSTKSSSTRDEFDLATMEESALLLNGAIEGHMKMVDILFHPPSSPPSLQLQSRKP